MADGDVRGELLAAGERIFASRGYAAATVDDVIRSSGTSRASFYRYFTGKEQLFEELSRQCFREMRDVIRAVASLGRGRVDRREVVGLLSRYPVLRIRRSTTAARPPYGRCSTRRPKCWRGRRADLGQEAFRAATSPPATAGFGHEPPCCSS
jgi:AcrR family transcriptional regulator